MDKPTLLLGMLLVIAAAFIGCGPPGSVKEEVIEVKEQQASAQAVQLLENYAKGQALGSEVTTFPMLITNVRKEDPFRADILEKGLAELQKSKGGMKAKAKEILANMAPQQRAPE